MNEYLERASYEWSEDSIRLINTANQNTKRTFFYVQEAGSFKTKPPYFTERENLDSFLLLYTTAGKGILKIDHCAYEITPGQMFWIPCMKHHYYACQGESWDFFWIHFNGIAARGYYEEYAKEDTPVALMQQDKETREHFHQILTLVQQKTAYSDLSISNELTNLLTKVLMANQKSTRTPSQIPAYVKNALKEIDYHFREGIRLEDLALKVGVSKYYLLKQFKRYIGCTIGEYIMLARSNYAKELLRYSEQSINEITFSCGMHNVSHFINMFRKLEHMTPLQYRKKWS